MKLLLLLTLGLAPAGCTKPPPVPSSTCFIRVQNSTRYDWDEVIVHPVSFGTIKGGATTEYQKAAELAEHPYFHAAVTNGRHFFWKSRRLDGDISRIEGGKYTFILRQNTNDSFEIARVRDR